ncbi:MAG: 4-hydroxy-3-methylbut-2-enyl diphosphate reductase [Actinobacteria bacterium]|nr:MAG: 4-hydroxy-3-methylbut-2-enyl diphosphate reductase [Actinomycetota bacterium]
MSALLVCVARRVEARAVRSGAPTADIVTRDAVTEPTEFASAFTARAARARAVAVMGLASALDGVARPGDLVVTTDCATNDTTAPMSSAVTITNALRARGLTVHRDPAWLLDALVDDDTTRVASFAAGRPVAVVRAITGHAPGNGWSPDDVTLAPAIRSLRAAAVVLDAWARACRERRVLVAGPRSFCAGVERAIEIVERALARRGAPVYVRRQIVHNAHVVEDLEARGAVFVEELHEVPDGATVVLAAHGVTPAVRDNAQERDLDVIDATCPLVAKVHREAKRFADRGYSIVLVGHEDHEEVQGTIGEAPNSIRVVASADEAERLHVADPTRVAWLTQTTLAVDEVHDVVDRLRARFPVIEGPSSDDICYATQNRQEAVRAIAPECDLLLVVGSRNSSNSNRLVEVAQREGCVAHLVEDDTELQLEWLRDAATIGITAGASAPDALVWRIIDRLRSLGRVEVDERVVMHESVRFTLPVEVR